MGAGDFNGLGANTSVLQLTGQAGMGVGPSTLIAMGQPESTGQSALGIFVCTATVANSARRILRMSAGNFVGYATTRTLSATSFVANNRAMQLGATRPGLVAATHDDAASPRVHLYTSSNGTVNDVEVLEPTYGTSTGGTGTLNTDLTGGANSARYFVGGIPAGANTFDGAICWAALVPAIVSLNNLQALAAGINPVSVLAEYGAGVRIVSLNDPASTIYDLADPTVQWTNTAVTARDDTTPMWGGDHFTPGGLIVPPLVY